MAVSAKKQVTQSASEAAQAVDAKKAAIAKRPNIIPKGKGVSVKSVMFDNVPSDFRVAAQLAMVIDAYYDVISERGGEHQLVQVSDLNDRLTDVNAFSIYDEEYVQDVPTVVKHYGQSILGKKAWKYKQGKIKIGQFK
tara:strand:- start:72 stop:485 length:414 start_codon:yes stop_codon:yes gene_type:complete